MAKKKESGNLGLIVTLVFFVLSTVILGVTTYMGFSTQEQKENDKKKAEETAKVAENKANWHRFQARTYRAMLDKSAEGTGAEVAEQKKQFDANTLPFATGQSDLEEFRTFLANLSKDLPWDANKETPNASAMTVIREYNKTIEGLRREVNANKNLLAQARTEFKEADEAFAKERAELKAATEAVKNDALKERQKDQTVISSAVETSTAENVKANAILQKLEARDKEFARLEAAQKKAQALLANATRENRELKERLDESTTRLAAMYEKTGQDPRAVDDAVLDARATQILKSWKNNWQITAMDNTGKTPYINLGSTDGLVPQVTFSIHAVGLDGRLNPIPKGTLEVVRIVGSNLAQARITSEKDAKRDPIIKGDRLFNPTWDPSRRKHVAIAGLADLGGEGSDNTEDFRRLLGRQGVEVDAFVDLKDPKGPKIAGKGISVGTDYLILADNLDAVNHPKARDKDFVGRYEKLVRELKDAANSNGVTVISLRKYLEMIGYRAPRIARPAPVLGFGS